MTAVGAVTVAAVVLAGCSGQDDEMAQTVEARAPAPETPEVTDDTTAAPVAPGPTVAATETEAPDTAPQAIDPYLIPDLSLPPRELWTVEAGDVAEAHDDWAPPVSAVGTGQSTLVLNLGPDIALVDLESGAELWRRSGDQDPAAAISVIGETDRLIAHGWGVDTSGGREAMILDLATGAELSRTTVSLTADAHSSIFPHGENLLYYESRWQPDGDGDTQTVARLDPDTLDTLWSVDAGSTSLEDLTNELIGGSYAARLPGLTPSADSGLARLGRFSGSAEPELVLIDLESGEVVGEPVRPGPWDTTWLAVWNQDILVSVPDMGSSPVTAWSLGGDDASHDPGHEPLWRVDAEQTLLVSELASRDLSRGAAPPQALAGIFTANSGPAGAGLALHRHDPTTGSALWSAPAIGNWSIAGPEPALQIPFASQDLVIIEEGATWVALDGATGARLGTHPFGSAASPRFLGAGAEHFYIYDTYRDTLAAYHVTDGESWWLELHRRTPRFTSGALLLLDMEERTVTRMG